MPDYSAFQKFFNLYGGELNRYPGGAPRGRGFSGYRQPGGGFEIGRPAIGYDNRAAIPEAGMYGRWSREANILPERKSKFDGLKGDALIQARKEHQAKLKAHNERVNKLAKNF